MGYDITNNSSIVELSKETIPLLETGIDPIIIPETLPADPLVLTDAIEVGKDNTGGNENLTIGGDKYYKHTQGIAAYIWDIYHSLNKRPAIHCEDMSGNEMLGY